MEGGGVRIQVLIFNSLGAPLPGVFLMSCMLTNVILRDKEQFRGAERRVAKYQVKSESTENTCGGWWDADSGFTVLLARTALNIP